MTRRRRRWRSEGFAESPKEGARVRESLLPKSMYIYIYIYSYSYIYIYIYIYDGGGGSS